MRPKLFKVDEMLVPFDERKKRRLKDMKNAFFYKEDAEKLDPNTLIYEYYRVLGLDVCCALTLLYPGKIGREYFMTKGHYHKDLRGEVYFCLSGNGMLLFQNREGKVESVEFRKGMLLYNPGDYAHRAINTGTEVLSFLTFFLGEIEHDYESIEREGFKLLVVEEGGKPTVKRRKELKPR
jgi:glucose-6-phosphate isomerase